MVLKRYVNQEGGSTSEKRRSLSVGPYLAVEEAQTGQVLYLPPSIVRRNFWHKEKFPGFPYNLNQGVSWARCFLADDLAIETERTYSSKIVKYYLIDLATGKKQELERWAHFKLIWLAHKSIGWNSFWVFDGGLIFELRAYTGMNSGEAVISFVFHSKEEAEKFVLPEWARDCVKEITGLPGFSDMELAEKGFPSF